MLCTVQEYSLKEGRKEQKTAKDFDSCSLMFLPSLKPVFYMHFIEYHCSMFIVHTLRMSSKFVICGLLLKNMYTKNMKSKHF